MQQTVVSDESKTSLPASGVVAAPRSRRKSSVFAMLVFLVFAALVGYYVHFAVVDGISMVPTFKNGQRLTVSNAYWLVGPIKDNDIVVLHDDYKDSKTGYIVKRVYRMGGEKVDLANTPHGWSIAKGPYTVPQGTIFVLGDNWLHSEDSRVFGAVPISKVVGKVIIKP